MSKYEPLWKWITANRSDDFTLTFAKIESITGLPIDHSFLILIFKLKVYKKSSKSSNKWLLRRFFVYTLIKN